PARKSTGIGAEASSAGENIRLAGPAFRPEISDGPARILWRPHAPPAAAVEPGREARNRGDAGESCAAASASVVENAISCRIPENLKKTRRWGGANVQRTSPVSVSWLGEIANRRGVWRACLGAVARVVIGCVPHDAGDGTALHFLP